MVVSPILVYAAIAAVGLLGAKVVLKKDTQKEERRRAANRMAGTLRSYGFKKIPQFFEDYGVGDYSGMAHSIGNLARTALEGEDAVVKELQEVFKNVLAKQVETEEGRAYIEAVVSNAKSNPVAAAVIKPLVANAPKV